MGSSMYEIWNDAILVYNRSFIEVRNDDFPENHPLNKVAPYKIHTSIETHCKSKFYLNNSFNPEFIFWLRDQSTVIQITRTIIYPEYIYRFTQDVRLLFKLMWL